MTTFRIQRDAALGTATRVDGTSADGDASFGALTTARGVLPLVAMDIRGRISGLVAHTTVEQTFRNALDEPLEATYIFPLPDRAAVTSFRMKVGERVIEAELKERGQAREDYERAIVAGFRAGIAEEERSGTFNLRVGNIPPRETVTVVLTLVGPIPVADGEATFRFPLVVAPRYVPGIPLDGPSVGAGHGHDTDQVPDASRVTPPVLLPGFPNPVRLSLEVQLDLAGIFAGANETVIRSSLHTVVVGQGAPWTVRLEPGERLDRDFILRIPVCAAGVQSLLQYGEKIGSQPPVFSLTLVPPKMAADAVPQPRDVVVVLDRSGSMSGWKMVAARRAAGRMIDSLLDQDAFTLLAFDESAEYPPHAAKKLVPATNQNRWKAVEWLGNVNARGGTELGPALEQAVRLLAGSNAARQPIIVIVTDGQVSGEDVILKTVQHSSGGRMPRIHTVGIDEAVNEGFLRRLADLGQGTFDLVESEARLDEAMDHIHRTIATPALKQLRLEPIGWEMEKDCLAPERLPDLYDDRPLMIFGRCADGSESLKLRIHGVDAGGREWQQEVVAQSGAADVLQSMWGRAKVRELEDRYAAEGDRHDVLQKRIVSISLSSRVLSRFTAFVAVDRSQVVNAGGRQHKIVQPVEMPEGWDAIGGGSVMCQRAPAAGAMRSMMGLDPEMLDNRSRSTSRRKTRSSRQAPEASRIDPAPPRATVVEVIREIRKQLQVLVQSNVMRLRSFVKQLDRINLLLEELSAALRRENQVAAADQLDKVVRELHASYSSKFIHNPRTLDEVIRKSFAAEVSAMLDLIEPTASRTPAERVQFWT